MGKIGYVMSRLHIKRGVYDGVLTEEQIEAESEFWGLTQEEKTEVRERISNSTYEPYVYEDEEPLMEEKKEPTPENNISERELYEHVRVNVREEVFNKTLEECNKKMEENEGFRKRYLLDEKTFINAIHAQKDDTDVQPWDKMMIAVKKVNEERIKRIRAIRDIWVCGTFTSNKYRIFIFQMSRMFYYDDISNLVKCLEEERELTDEQKDILRIIVYKIPYLSIHSSPKYLE